MFLTPDELVTLTGYRKKSAQIRWLKARRIRHEVNGAGHPVIARAWLAADSEPQALEPARQRPNLRAIPGSA